MDGTIPFGAPAERDTAAAAERSPDAGAARQPAAPDPRLGELLDDRYRLDRLLAVGGMGSVYQGRHVRIGRPVAVKILHPEFTKSPTEVERFEREARLAVRLSSPHVVEVLDFGQTSAGERYLVMELLAGRSLRERLAREGRLDPVQARGLLRQLMQGLGAAHAAGIVHRDLKPDNLWLVPSERGERLKILDFGVAKAADPSQESALTRVGVVVGTPEYLAPEQAVGGEVDHRADLYSAGIVAWVLLTGRHPFPGREPHALLRAHAFDPVPSPDREVPELARFPELLRFVERATEKDRAVRAQSAAELLDLLDGKDGRAHNRPTTRSAPPPGAAPAAGGTAGDLAPTVTASRAPLAARTLSVLVCPLATGTPRTVNLTLLLCEIADYADLANLPAEELARLLTEYDHIVLPALRTFHGRRVRARAEALMAAFASPTNAVLCGMAILDRLAGRDDQLDGARLSVRMAAHLGEVRWSRGDLVGEAVELAEAVRAQVPSGEIWLTRTVYLAMNHGEVPVEPRAAVAALEDREPIPVYRVQQVAGALPYGGREAARVVLPHLSGLIEPLADGVTSIADGSAEGRLRASLRVSWAAGALLALGMAGLTTGLLLLPVALAAWTWPGRRWIDRARQELHRALAWRARRVPVHRAALIRPLR